MKNNLGNAISWSSVLIVFISYSTNEPIYLVIGILIATILDLFDGRVARRFGDNKPKTMKFGELTDSLCDIINFGIAPTLLLATLMYQNPLELSVIIASFIFVVSGLFRLARFSANKTTSLVPIYHGLPITVAGPIYAFISLYITNPSLLIALAIIMSVLMISDIKIKKI
ncbi:MAG: CDP-alcohol phosphatidyltransferase family protein [Spiroplasma sp.]|nr:CDP-alcohol phosphatidyltransferase family protein [Mycoplasmatales bacterium]